MIVTPTRTMRDIAPQTNDQRRAAWAYRYYRAGLHHRPEPAKPPTRERTPCDRMTAV